MDDTLKKRALSLYRTQLFKYTALFPLNDCCRIQNADLFTVFTVMSCTK